MNADNAALLDEFCDAVWLEDGLADVSDHGVLLSAMQFRCSGSEENGGYEPVIQLRQFLRAPQEQLRNLS